MDLFKQGNQRNCSGRSEWRFQKYIIVIMYIYSFIIQTNCHPQNQKSDSVSPKTETVDIKESECHSCESSSKIDNKNEGLVNNENDNIVQNFIATLTKLTDENQFVNKTISSLENKLEILLDKASSEDNLKIIDGVEIKAINKTNQSIDEQVNKDMNILEGRALFSKFSYEYRIFEKIKDFINTHIISINVPKTAKYIGFRSFGLNKFFLPILIGGQVLIKSILFAMFLPSILGSFGKILGKGLSQISSTSSQASYPPANGDDQTAYNTDNKDIMGYETNNAGTYTYPQEGMYDMEANDVNELGNVDMSRFGAGGQSLSYLPSKNSYYKNQMVSAVLTVDQEVERKPPSTMVTSIENCNTDKTLETVFQKIPASSMILSNYDPFYSPLLSRLDGIFARLGLAPSENAIDNGMQIGGQSISDVKLEACREQLICLMYASPAKYAPYSNLVSAQLSRELNELRRPVSDNPEILRFFRYMRAARRGQEGVECMRAHPTCLSNAAPEHTMIAAYHDINKLVTARKLRH